MRTRRLSICCSQCLDTIFTFRDGYEHEPHRCALCSCYLDGALTEAEALRETQTERNMTKKAALEVVCSYKRMEKLVYPTGYSG